MTQKQYTTAKRTFKHLTKEKRAQIEILLRQGLLYTIPGTGSWNSGTDG